MPLLTLRALFTTYTHHFTRIIHWYIPKFDRFETYIVVDKAEGCKTALTYTLYIILFQKAIFLMWHVQCACDTIPTKRRIQR